jgi:Ca2+-dependent lipid-binding protein
MAQGRLRVTIVEAAKLVDKDKTDFNDPYVEVYVDEKQKQKTATINNVERPVWDETFDLYVIIFYFCSLFKSFFFYEVIYGQVMNIFT